MTQSAKENVLWDLFVLEYARGRNQPIASLIQGAYTEGTINVPFSFVVARSGDRIALIDTGFMREETGLLMAQKFGIPEWISPLRLCTELHITPDKVADIVISHAHFYHMGLKDKYSN